MNIKATLLSNKALKAYRAGDLTGALSLFREAKDAGLKDPRSLLSYVTLMLRAGEYTDARALLRELEKLPGLNEQQKNQLFMDYAVCCYKMGEIDKGVSLLERQHQHMKSELIYQTLGYLYVEQGNPKAIEYNLEAVDYDDEDPICLDNLAQSYYRVAGDKEAARPWFEKALALKPGQIDTLWFLSRYDIEAGDTAAAVAKLEKVLEGRFSPLNYVNKEMAQAELDRLKAGQEADK